MIHRIIFRALTAPSGEGFWGLPLFGENVPGACRPIADYDQGEVPLITPSIVSDSASNVEMLPVLCLPLARKGAGLTNGGKRLKISL